MRYGDKVTIKGDTFYPDLTGTVVDFTYQLFGVKEYQVLLDVPLITGERYFYRTEKDLIKK